MNFNSSIIDAIIHGQLDDDEETWKVFANRRFERNKQTRSIRHNQCRLNWQEHLAVINNNNGFESRYHMSLATFDKLVDILREKVTINFIKSRNSTGGEDPIYPELVVAAGLRYLGGEHFKSIADIFHIHEKSARRIVFLFLDAVEASIDNINLPSTTPELVHCAKGWMQRSQAGSLFFGWVTAMDGWLCSIQKPSEKNPADYYSKHYECFGLNVQAACDSNLRFTYCAVVACGKTNDARAYRRLDNWNKWIDNLPSSFFSGGDNAYCLTNNFLIPYSGAEAFDTNKSAYNFYHSQLRIWIEMAFGRLTTKWRIFRRNLTHDIGRNSQIVDVAMRLHNFVIDHDNLQYGREYIFDGDRNTFRAMLGIDPLDGCEDGEMGYRGLPVEEDSTTEYEGESRRRDILAEVVNHGLRRPTRNLVRNSRDA